MGWEQGFVTDRQRDLIRQAIIEFIGPFALMFIGGGAIIATAGQNLVAIALAHGLAIGLMVASAGHITGGVYNPALTVGLVSTRRLPVNRGVIYIISQLLGCIAAALVLKAMFPSAAVDAVQLGTPQVGAGFSVGAALAAEIIGTFFLMYAVFGTAIDSRGAKEIAGLVIGLVITMDIFGFGQVSGAAMNPARALGPALVQNFWSDQWIYWVGPIAGAIAAALLFNYVFIPPAEAEPDVEIDPGAAPRESRSVPARRRRR